jgi:hypothetical protein
MERNENIKRSYRNKRSTRRGITSEERYRKCDEWNEVSGEVFVDINDLFATYRKANVMLVLSFMVFAAAFAVAAGVIVTSMAPQWDRIVRLAFGNIEPASTLVSTFPIYERRVAERRWTSPVVSTASVRWNAVA